MLIKDIMSRRLIMVAPNEMAFAAVRLMVENNISGVVVEDRKRAIGMITMKDIIRRVMAARKDVYTTPVRDVMTSPVLSVNELTAVESAAAMMGERKVKRLVAVDEKNKVVGIITAMDIVSNLPNLLEVMFQTWVKPDWR